VKKVIDEVKTKNKEKYQKPEVKVQAMSMKALLGDNGWFISKKNHLALALC